MKIEHDKNLNTNQGRINPKSIRVIMVFYLNTSKFHKASFFHRVFLHIKQYLKLI